MKNQAEKDRSRRAERQGEGSLPQSAAPTAPSSEGAGDKDVLLQSAELTDLLSGGAGDKDVLLQSAAVTSTLPEGGDDWIHALEREEKKPESRRTLIRRRVVSIVSVLIFIAFSVAVMIYVGRPMLEFVRQPEAFRDWVDQSGIWGRLAFIGMTLLQIIIAIIPGEPLEVGAGYAFGFWEGSLLCMIGICIGSTLIYLFSRHLGVRAVEAFYPREKLMEMKFLKDTPKLNSLVFILFFIPGTPKDMLTYLIGLTPMKLSTFLLIACTARIPSVITSVIAGGALGTQKYTEAVVIFAVTGVISLIGILFYNRRFGKRKQETKTD